MSGFAGIPRDMTGLPVKLLEAGYATHQVRKWNAGMATPEHTPKGRSFQSSFGYFHHANDYYIYREGEILFSTHSPHSPASPFILPRQTRLHWQ